MTSPENNENEGAPADRGAPSVAITPKSQKIIAGCFLVLAALVMVLVVIDGAQKSAPKSLVEPREVVFKTPGSAAPYIKTEGKERAPSHSSSADPVATQKELALQQEALHMAQEQQKKLAQRIQSPQIVYDQSKNQAPAGNQTAVFAAQTTSTAANPGSESLVAGSGAEDANTAFATQNANKDVETAQASQMQNLHALIAQGAMISGILETAIQSDLPGMVRAIVSENIYSFDGARLLIPQGSRLIGQYRSGLVRGQSRVFVIWNRLIRNDGVSINIGSTGADDLGRSGLGGDVDTHFFERFGSSVLLSLIDTGLQVGAGNANNGASATVAVNTGNDFSRAAEIALQNSIAIPPTVNVDQGTRIKVFVGKDLDFSRVSNNPSGL
ncbi:MAG: type IV secretion system protein VirB10 [Pseudomonadota bacterium]